MLKSTEMWYLFTLFYRFSLQYTVELWSETNNSPSKRGSSYRGRLTIQFVMLITDSLLKDDGTRDELQEPEFG